jgi:hypothetical protein
MNKIKNLLSTLFFTTVLINTPCYAATILDQSHLPPAETLSFPIWSDIYAAQSFTVGQSGLLSQIDLSVQLENQGTGNLWLDIRRTVLGIPIEDDLDVLGSIVIPMNNVPTHRSQGFLEVDVLELGVAVSEGDELAIVLHSEPSTNITFLWNGVSFGDSYSQGTAFRRDQRNGPTPWIIPGSAYDLSFQTYVTTVPVPSAVWLFGSGLIALIGLARKKL